MASVAGQQIDSQFQNTSLLNKSASQSTSLYQKCSLLHDKLLRIRGFTEHFPEITSSSNSTDPVTHLWDIFSMGTPLCYIFDQLPAEDGFKRFEDYYSLSKRNYEFNLDRAKKHAIALFAMQVCGGKLLQKVPECEMFTVMDLWNRDSTDGLVKVVNTVTAIIDYLPKDVFKDEQVSTNFMIDTNDKDGPHHNITREILETERKYVQDLETMQLFSNALSQANIGDQDTIHLLFPNLNQLVDFHCEFLTRFEFVVQLPLRVQRWGQQFIECEEQFSVYESYCVNYKNATEVMLSNEQTLAVLNHVIDVKHELPILLLKPIQRSLAKALSNQGYDHQYELIRGSEVAKRVIDKINEAQRREENQQIVRNLKNRVQDWKGHHLENFGDLLLHDVFVVDHSDFERVFVAFLFRRIMVFFRVDYQRKGSKKKQLSIKERLAISSVMASTPLFLRARVFMSLVISVFHIPVHPNSHSSSSSHYNLKITWHGEDGLDSFTIQFNRQEQMKQWKDCITSIIQSRNSPSTHSQPEVPLDNSSSRNQLRHFDAPPASASRYSTASNLTYVPHRLEDSDGETDSDSEREKSLYDMELLSDDEDDLEDYPPPSYPPSGRDTPVGDRALTRSRSLPSRFKFEVKGKNNEAPSHKGRTSPRARSNSLPATTASMPILSNATSEPSDNERASPKKIPQAPNSRSLTPIAQNLFQSPRRASGTPRPVKVNLKLKVHYKDDLFLLLVPRTISYEDLIEKMKRKIALCGPSPDDGPLKVKYKDEDGDLVSLTATEDMELVLDQLGPGKEPYASFYVS